MEIHANGTDGIVHVHDCPTCVPPYDGGAACFWAGHDSTFRQTHKATALAGLTQQHKEESNPEHKARIKKALETFVG